MGRVYSVTPEVITAELARFHVDFGRYPTVRELAARHMWMLADVAAKLHDMVRTGQVICEPGRVYRPRCTVSVNPPTPMEVQGAMQTEGSPTKRTLPGRKPGRPKIKFPPDQQLLAEADAAVAAGENAIAVLGEQYDASKPTMYNRLRKAHMRVNGLNAPPRQWNPSRKPRPLRSALTMTGDATAQSAPAEAEALPDATDEAGEGVGLPQAPAEAQGDSEGKNDPKAERHLRDETPPAFDPRKIDFAGMTETAEEPAGVPPLPSDEPVSPPAEEPMDEWRRSMAEWRKAAQDPTLREVLEALVNEGADDAFVGRFVRRLVGRKGAA